jgi:gluconolactonase
VVSRPGGAGFTAGADRATSPACGSPWSSWSRSVATSSVRRASPWPTTGPSGPPTGAARARRTSPDGTTTVRVGALGGEPNGVCLDAAGRVVANLAGSVQRLDPATGQHETFATGTDDRPTPTPNFVACDGHGAPWVTNTAMRTDLARAYDDARPDGFVYRIADGRSTIVADGLFFANGVAFDRDERHLYVAESNRHRVLRFPVREGVALGPGVPYGPDLGTAPDGIAFDDAGSLWVACPGINALGVVRPDGGWEIVVADPGGRTLALPTNLAFGDDDGRTLWVGNPRGEHLPCFRVEVPGLPLPHQRR